MGKKMKTILMTGALFVGAAFGGAAVDTYVQASPSAITIDSENAIPEGTELRVVLREPVGAHLNGVGDRIAVDLVRPLAARGEVVLPVGTTIHGEVVAIAKPATRGNQVAIAVRFDEIMHRGRALQTTTLLRAVNETGARPRSSGSFGEILKPEDAVAHTGIDFDEREATVISLGMGDVEPMLNAGTGLVLTTAADTPLR